MKAQSYTVKVEPHLEGSVAITVWSEKPFPRVVGIAVKWPNAAMRPCRVHSDGREGDRLVADILESLATVGKLEGGR
jgi:hypothetical protein